MGLMQGHWTIHPEEHNKTNFNTSQVINESIALGIAIVVPAKKILEVLNQPELVAIREKHILDELEKHSSTSTE